MSGRGRTGDSDDASDDDDFCMGGGGGPCYSSGKLAYEKAGPTLSNVSTAKLGSSLPAANSGLRSASNTEVDYYDWGEGSGQVGGASATRANVTNPNSNKPGPIPRPNINTLKKDDMPIIPFVVKYDAITLGRALQSIWTAYGASANDKCIFMINNKLVKSFQECKNPYAMALNNCVYAFDFKYCKTNTLSFEIINQLKHWLTKVGLKEVKARYLSKELQLVALQIVEAQRNIIFAKLIAEVYGLEDVKFEAIGRIQKLCSEKHYREACQLATTLKIYSEFDIHAFVVPLILQDREQIVEEYIAGSQQAQIAFLTLIDSWLDAERVFDTVMAYVRTHNVDNVKPDKIMNVKPLSKLVKRLSEKFNIECPNSRQKVHGSTLRHLIFRRYEETLNPLNDDCFEELVDSAVQDDPVLWDEALNHMRRYGDTTTAAKFAVRKSMHLDKIPKDVQKVMKELYPSLEIDYVEDEIVEEDWETGEVRIIKPSQPAAPFGEKGNKAQEYSANVDLKIDESKLVDSTDLLRSEKEYYNLQLPLENIALVDTPERVDSFLLKLKDASAAQKTSEPNKKFITAFDAEWKPIVASQPGVALIQISLDNQVFLIDTHSLTGKSGHWSEKLFDQYFGCQEIIKIGFNVASDLPKLAQTSPDWSNIKHKIKCLMDLHVLSKLLLKKRAFYPYLEASAEIEPAINSLSDLVHACFGMKLDKSEQFSDWERRPLRSAQVVYAATDAYILMHIYDFLQKRCEILSIDFNDIVQRTLKLCDRNVSAGDVSAKKPKH